MGLTTAERLAEPSQANTSDLVGARAARAPHETIDAEASAEAVPMEPVTNEEDLRRERR